MKKKNYHDESLYTKFKIVNLNNLTNKYKNFRAFNEID